MVDRLLRVFESRRELSPASAEFDTLSRLLLDHVERVMAGVERGEPWAIEEARRMAAIKADIGVTAQEAANSVADMFRGMPSGEQLADEWAD